MIKNIPEQLMVVSYWGVSGLTKFEIIQSENFRLFFHTDWVLMFFLNCFVNPTNLTGQGWLGATLPILWFIWNP